MAVQQFFKSAVEGSETIVAIIDEDQLHIRKSTQGHLPLALGQVLRTQSYHKRLFDKGTHSDTGCHT